MRSNSIGLLIWVKPSKPVPAGIIFPIITCSFNPPKKSTRFATALFNKILLVSWKLAGAKIDGCFKPLINIEDIHKKKFYDINKEEWKRRLDVLEEVIRGKISEDIPEKEVEEMKLFYDV